MNEVLVCKAPSVRSNLISDTELMMNFQKELEKIAGIMYHRFYKVRENMDVDDVVSECWKKVISQNVSYDPSKSSLSTFAGMIVSSRLLDLTRTCTKTTRVQNCMSLDVEIDPGDGKAMLLQDVIADPRSEVDFKMFRLEDEVKEFIETFTAIPNLGEIIGMLAKGFTMEKVSEMTGTDYRMISIARSVMRQVHSNRVSGKAVPMSDLLYYESQDWKLNYEKTDLKEVIEKSKRDWKRWALLIDWTYLINDLETGVNLCSIIRLILRNFTYKRISDKLNISISKIQEMLYRYEPVMI